MTSRYIFVAGIMSFLLAGIHIFGGGADVHLPIIHSSLDPVLKGFVSVIWHAVSAMLIICSIMLAIAAKREELRQAFTLVVIATYTSFIGLFLFYGITRLGTVTDMLPWIPFLIITCVCILGLMKDQKQVDI